MLAPGQVSDILKILPSTLRHYVKDSRAHLSEMATKNGARSQARPEINETLRT